MVNNIVFIYYCKLLYISFPLLHVVTMLSGTSAKGNINDCSASILKKVNRCNKSATVSEKNLEVAGVGAISHVTHEKKKGTDLEKTSKQQAWRSSHVTRPRRNIKQSDLEKTSKRQAWAMAAM